MKQDGRQPPQAKLIVFLGNPGKQYQYSRHNLGWIALQAYLDSGHASAPDQGSWKEKFHGIFFRAGDVVLLKPQTYINGSGRSVQAAATFFGIPREATLVVHDDLETPFGSVEITQGGGHRGNNGVRSIMTHCGGPDFFRLRVGIGRPPGHRKPGDWVLERFSREEEAELPDVLDRVTELIRQWLR